MVDEPADAVEEVEAVAATEPRRGPEALAALLAPPVHPDVERLLIVARLASEGGGDEEPRYLFVRWPDWPHPALLSIEPPAATDTLEDAVGSLLRARLDVGVRGTVRVSSERVPVRMPLRRYGTSGTGWLRAALVDVAGEPEPDALLEGFEALTLAEALAALPTDVERAVLRGAAELL
ncbi:MAG: hypothetical protein K1X87_04860 [Dehalococcoidia bacterium]|nr:hypothetical protein [Dehalococcoidia bacterium]